MSHTYQDPFITVVSVGIEDKTPKKAVNNSEYITVLTIGNEESKSIKDVTEEVIVYRLPGERLGFGLKFEGGTKTHEFVKRLFIQSCAPDSPASRAQSSWGQLVEGDEVLEIDSIPVNGMTRIDCVRFLKDSNVAIKLLVKHCFDTHFKSSEDIPVIVSSEEKKPPPVPPRKLHRKLHKIVQNNCDNENIVPTIKQETFSSKSTRLQSPRNSFKKKYSPDVSRRLSDGSLGPPDAEVYFDLISQESTHSLSESDDTGSTISTVLDRFASFPTTTTSSFAGSLPSTPTSIQKQLDFSYIINEFPDDDFIPVLKNRKGNRVEENNNIIPEPEEELFKLNDEVDNIVNPEPKRPVIIPRSRDKINKNIQNDNSNNTLPRLVDFVPKNQKDMDSPMDTIVRFLDSERFDFEYNEKDNCQENEDIEYNMDVYNSKWILSSHLSTIGEDEEEHNTQEGLTNFGIPWADREISEGDNEETPFIEIDKQASMEIPPTDSRQPPDGHEFPDFIETYNSKSTECDTNFKTTWSQPVIKPLDRSMSSSNCDLRPNKPELDEESTEKSNLLHNRSQSLIDMSIYSKEKSSTKWNTLMEQRKSRLSKLKGLVIPEAAENEITPVLNIPEITSIETSPMEVTIKPVTQEIKQTIQIKDVPPIVLPSWSINTNLPKYSPAFKRKSLQVYSVNATKKSDSSDVESSYDEYISKYSDSTPSRTTDDPKSLESIASPTRSDCSFDYNSLKTNSIKDNHLRDFGDSDNDSAVSSSQSSYNSRSSPPPSPTSEEKLNDQRMLKPSSVEAINRKNILASAKCSSGKDSKIGSPVIQRKGSLEEDEKEVSNNDSNGKVCDLEDKHEVLKIVAENTMVTSTFVDNAIQCKPVPMKRTHLQTVRKDEENRFEKRSASSILEKRNKPINVQSLRANFENAANQSSPVFPKSYKTDKTVASKITNGNPLVTRRKSEEVDFTRRKSNDKFNENLGEQPKVEIKRVSRDNVKDIVKKPAASPDVELRTVVLHLDESGSSLGITLAGGVDYENKNITIHRIRYGSIAYQDGRLKKGDKVVSINDHLTAELTHSAATELLKAPSSTFTIVIEESKEFLPYSNLSRRTSISSLSSETKGNETSLNIVAKKPTNTFKIVKDAAGLGFSIEGGKDSPKGDVPLVIKKIFSGGAADKSGTLKVGDEILSMNNVNFQTLSRIEAWSQMKKFPDGEVTIELHR